MRISANVSPKSVIPGIERLGENTFKIKVKAPPEKGEANKETVAMIADYFHVPKSKVRILRGHTARIKIIEIMGPE
jgi:uncharacterized protein (TIGR00251 family)